MAGANSVGRWVLMAVVLAAPTLAFAQATAGSVDAAEKKLVGAEGLLARGQNDLAAREFDEFLKQFPTDPRISRARFGKALAAYNSNDPATAAASLEIVSADKSFPRREEALALLGTIDLAQNRPDRALATLDTLLKEFPNGTQAETAAVNRAQALYRLGRFADSLAAAKEFLQAHPKSPLKATALYVSALDQRGLGDNAAATATFKQVTAEFPNAPFIFEAQLQIGEALAAQGKFDEAIAYDRALQTQVPESRKPAAMFGLGMALSQAGRYTEAEQLFDNLAVTYKTSPFAGAAKLQKAVAQVKAGDRNNARDALAAVAKDFPAQASAAAYWLARCDLLEGKYDAARRALERLAAGKTADLPEIQFDLAYCDLMTGADDPAIRKLEAFRAAYPNSPHLPEALFYEGTALHRLGDFEHSLQFCDAAAGEKSPVARQALLLKAENLLMLGRYDKADAVLASLEKQPASEAERLLVLFRRGQAAYFTGDYKTAQARLAEVVRAADSKDPTLREAQFFLGDTQLQQHDYAAAVVTLKNYLAQKTGRTDEAAYKLAMAQLGAKDEAAGKQTLHELMQSGAQSPWVQRAWLEDAQLAYEKSDTAQAITSAEKVLSTNPAEEIAAPASFLLAKIEMDQSRFPQAADRLAALAKTYPKNSLAEDAAFFRGLSLEQAHRPAEAQQQFAAYLQTYSAGKFAADARHQSAVCMTAQGKSADAIKTLSELASHRETRNAGVLHDLALAYSAADDAKHAMEIYQAILTEFPQTAHARSVRVELPDLLFAEKHYQEAVDLLTAALADPATDARLRPVALYRLGHCYVRLGQFANAAATFDAFAKAGGAAPDDPLLPDALSEAGDAYAHIDKLDEAANRENRVLKDFPNSAAAPLALLRLGEIQNQAAQYDAAGQTFTTWINQYTKNPLMPLAQFGLGWSLENRRKFPEARDAYAKVTASDNGPTAARAQFQIGETWFAQKQFDDAARELLKVDILYACPEWSAPALYDAGRAFEQGKKIEEAKQQYRQCLKKYKDSDVAIMCRKRLEALGG